jgi:drug/metabolite transporter (DMT)-like permease
VRRAYFYTLLVVLSWASSLVLNKAMLLAERGGARLTPTQVAFWAILVGWVCLLLLLLVRGRLRHLGDIAGRGWAILVLMGCFGWAGYTVALNYAFTQLPLPDAIIINYLHPMFVVMCQGPAFGAVVRRLSHSERVPDRSGRPGAARLALGFLLCLAGVALIATRGEPAGLLRLQISAGALAALFAAFAWGVYSNLGRFVTLRPGQEVLGASDLHSFLAMTVGLVVMGASLVATGQTGLPVGYHTALFVLNWGPVQVPASSLVLFSGMVVYGGGFTLWLYALELGARLGEAHKLPPLTYLTPVLSVALGWAVLHQGAGPGFWQGAGLIAVGNLVIVLHRNKSDDHSPVPNAV